MAHAHFVQGMGHPQWTGLGAFAVALGREGDFKGADVLAWDVALAAEAANSQGLAVGIVALDMKNIRWGVTGNNPGHT